MSNIKEFELITNEIHKKLKDFRDQGLKLVGSSSFQTQSVPLLHILSQFESKIEIIFLDTGFLHPETHQFRKEITRKFGLHIRIERSEIPRSEERRVGKECRSRWSTYK